MENKKNYNNFDDIEFAVRIFPKNSLIKNIRIIHIIISFIVFSSLFFFVNNKNYLKFTKTTKSNLTENDARVLGHFPYQEAAYENLIEIQPNILVHKEMYKSLKDMQDHAERDGIYLVLLSGYRSIKLQKQIFYS